MLSESLWKKQKSFLEEQASNISTLKKQITKEAEIDANVQLSINDKIQKLKENATRLAKKLQNEKHKNAELGTIISLMKGKMEQQRLEEASFRDNNNSQNLNVLENKFKKLQYDLGQVNGKVNRLCENLEQKRNKISQNRTERVIDSGIFRNIEKELIDSELIFKKLLIEKIRHQKQYEKNVQEYNSLKEKAENYYVRKDSARGKTNKNIGQEPTAEDPAENYKRKFLQIEMKRTNNTRYTAQLKIQEQLNQQEQKCIMRIKKMLIETNLDTSQELINYFTNIQEINDKYFNEINIFTDQSNEIQKYLAEAETLKKGRKINFYQEKPELTKQQLTALEIKSKKLKADHIKTQIDQANQELIEFCQAENFQLFLNSLTLQPTPCIEDGCVNFDILKETLRQLDQNVSQFLHTPMKIQQEQNTTARNNSGQQKLQDLINKVRKTDECMKVMKKQEFKDQYQRMLKNTTQKSQACRSLNKKKSFPSIKK